MSEPFLSEIRIFAFSFPPRGWAQCDGQILPISQNQALFSLLGTSFGGDGETNFALPDMRGRAPINFGHGSGLSSRPLGSRGGQATVALTVQQMPAHEHTLNASPDPASALTAQGGNKLPSRPQPGFNNFGDTPNADGHPDQVSGTGAGAGHNNLQPYQAVNFCIALQGLFPSRS